MSSVVLHRNSESPPPPQGHQAVPLLDKETVKAELLSNELLKAILAEYNSLPTANTNMALGREGLVTSISEKLSQKKEGSASSSGNSYNTLEDLMQLVSSCSTELERCCSECKNKKEPITLQALIDKIKESCAPENKEGVDIDQRRLQILLENLGLSLDSSCKQVVKELIPDFFICIDSFYKLTASGIIEKDQQRSDIEFTYSFCNFMMIWGSSWNKALKNAWIEYTYLFRHLLWISHRLGVLFTSKKAIQPTKQFIWDQYQINYQKLIESTTRLREAIAEEARKDHKFLELLRLVQHVNKSFVCQPGKQVSEADVERLVLFVEFFAVYTWPNVCSYYDLQEDRKYPKQYSSEEDDKLYAMAAHRIEHYAAYQQIESLDTLLRTNKEALKDSCKKLKTFKVANSKGERFVFSEIYQNLRDKELELLQKLRSYYQKEEREGKVIIGGNVEKSIALELSYEWNEILRQVEELCRLLTPMEQMALIGCNDKHITLEEQSLLLQWVENLRINLEEIHTIFYLKMTAISQLEIYEKDLQYDWRLDVWDIEKESVSAHPPVDVAGQAAQEETEDALIRSLSLLSIETKNVSAELPMAAAEEEKEAQELSLEMICNAVYSVKNHWHEVQQVEGCGFTKQRLIQEIKAHSFLALQHLLHAEQAYRSGDFFLQGQLLSLHMGAIDAYVAIEQTLHFYHYVQTGETLKEHNFRIQVERPTYSEGVERFLQASYKGPLAVRYPSQYPEAIPSWLQPLYDKEVSIERKLRASAQLVKYMLDIVTKEQDPLVIEVKKSVDALLERLQNPENAVIVQKPEQVVKGQPNVQTSVQKLLLATQDKGTRERRSAEQIGLYIDLLMKGKRFNDTHVDSPVDHFARVRNQFLIGKVYEEIFVFVHNTMRSAPRELHNLTGLAQEVTQHFKTSGSEMPGKVLDSLEVFNVGNYGHYLFMRNRSRTKDVLSETYLDTLENSFQQSGFRLVNKQLDKAQNISVEKYEELQQAYDRLWDYLPNLLDAVSAIHQKASINKN